MTRGRAVLARERLWGLVELSFLQNGERGVSEMLQYVRNNMKERGGFKKGCDGLCALSWVHVCVMNECM